MYIQLVRALALTAVALAAPTDKRNDAKTILLSNDDGWAALNIRAAYRELSAAGYDVILSAPARQRSGWSGKFLLPDSTTLTEAGEFNYPAKGAPSWGHEQNDTNVWYFDGTPAAAVAFGLEYVIPKHFDNRTVDLVVAGPNEGTNLGPGMFTISGTIGATYNAVYRGVPGVAFSGSNGNNSFFKDFAHRENDSDLAANIYAKKVVEFVDQLFDGAKGRTALPITTGINVNFPKVGEDAKSCSNPAWELTRLSGKKSTAPSIQYNKNTGLFSQPGKEYSALAETVFGNSSLEGEAALLADGGCKTSVSVFSIDYDASTALENQVSHSLAGLF